MTGRARLGTATRRRLRPRRPVAAVVAAAAIVTIVLLAVLADVVRPPAHLATDLTRVLEPPSGAHPLGTDGTGRDLLAMVLRGLRVSLRISGAAAALALVVGGAVGVLAGAIGGRVDAVCMRLVDFFAAQNHLLFGLLVAVLARPVVGGAGAVTLAVGLTHWMLLARILRAEVLSLRERPFVTAAVGAGATRPQLVRHHLLPHLAPAAGLGFVLLFPHAIFHESALSFLGVGLPPEDPSLGTLIAAGERSLFAGGWWIVVFPGLAIVVTAVAVGTIGEWWRDRTQPRWRAELEL